MEARGIYTISPTGTATLVLDLEDQVNHYAQAGTFDVTMPPRKTVLAGNSRRYGGSRVVAESHDNAAVSWTHVVQGATGDDALARMATLLSVLETARSDLYFGWTPDGTTKQSFRAIRGTPDFSPAYDWATFMGSKMWKVDVTIPCSPLARAATPQTLSISSTTLPAVVSLASPILGDAPAAVDISLRTSSPVGSPGWHFALIAWWRRITATPLSGSIAPFGIVEADTGSALTTWTAQSQVDARGGTCLKATASGAGNASATYTLDPSVVEPDDWAQTVDVEIWARVYMSGIVTPIILLSLLPASGTSFGARRYPPIYGNQGKRIVPPSSGTAWRFMHIGTLTMPVDKITPVKWALQLDASWGAGSAGGMWLDYLVMVPARARALSPTGKPDDASYPRWTRSNADTTKTVRSDLSGSAAVAAGNPATDCGLGGVPIEMPPGDVDVLLKLSNLVPDDPTSDTTTEGISAPLVSASFVATNRYFLTNR